MRSKCQGLFFFILFATDPALERVDGGGLFGGELLSERESCGGSLHGLNGGIEVVDWVGHGLLLSPTRNRVDTGAHSGLTDDVLSY